MAGDWLKFEKCTLEKPEVFQIAATLGIDPDAVVGKLLRVWNWYDDQSRDGQASVSVLSLLDRYCGVNGFINAMKSVGWMIEKDGFLILPKFDRHNGTPAKSRALGKNRQQVSRSCHANSNAASVTKTHQERDESVTREEKRIEEKNIPPNPQGGKREKTGLDNLPTSPQAIRISQLYNRRQATPWSDKEVKAFKAIGTISIEDLELVCRYTEDERTKDANGRHRRDLATFLNNFRGELDRANAKSSPSPQKQIQFIDDL